MYILCDSSNNKNACDKVILHAEKEENFVHKTGGHFIMAKNMNGIKCHISPFITRNRLQCDL